MTWLEAALIALTALIVLQRAKSTVLLNGNCAHNYVLTALIALFALIPLDLSPLSSITALNELHSLMLIFYRYLHTMITYTFSETSALWKSISKSTPVSPVIFLENTVPLHSLTYLVIKLFWHIHNMKMLYSVSSPRTLSSRSSSWKWWAVLPLELLRLGPLLVVTFAQCRCVTMKARFFFLHYDLRTNHLPKKTPPLFL